MKNKFINILIIYPQHILKLDTRNYANQILKFNFYEAVFGFDRKLSETISIAIDTHGKGETTFTIPEGWKNYGDPCTVRRYYLKETESGEEFPRAYYVANPNKTEEDNKQNSQRIQALMLKVTDDEALDAEIEAESAVVLGEELDFEENLKNKKKDIIFPLLIKPRNDLGNKWGDDFYWAAEKNDNMATFQYNRKTNRCGSWQRKHAARDLYTLPRASVVAVCKGEVLEVKEFYARTDQITILHKTDDGREFIIRYGELAPNSIKLKKGDEVTQRQLLGFTGKLLKKNNNPVLKIDGQIVYMLHFEYYTGDLGYDLSKSLSNCEQPFARRGDLSDPLDLLKEGYDNVFKVVEETNDTRVAPITLKTSTKGIEFIKGWESEKKQKGKHVLYDDDAGYCTIGWGHLVSGKNSCNSISNISQDFKNGLTDDEAKELLKKDVKVFENFIRKNVSVNLYQHEFDALVSFAFNLGGSNFKSSTLLKKLNAKKYDEVPLEFAKWNKSGGVIMTGLTTRRKREANIFKNNTYDSTH